MPPPNADNSIERKIVFFRAFVGQNRGGQNRVFDVRPALERLRGMPFQLPGRYVEDENGNPLCAWPEAPDGNPKVVFGRIRRNDLPSIEEGGRIDPLAIPDRAGIAELTHLVFFDRNIVGADFNHYGPRVPRFGNYLAATCRNDFPAPVPFLPLLQNDVLAQLDALDSVRCLEIQVLRAYVDRVAEADQDIFEALNAARRVGGAEELELTLRPRRQSRGFLGREVLDRIRRLARLEDLRTGVTNFKVSGVARGAERIEEIDVLADKLVSTKRILRSGDRTRRSVDREAAFAAIEDAYIELRDELERAPVVAPR